MKIRAMVAELFHADRPADGRTDMTKLAVAFGNFANAPTKGTRGFIVYYKWSLFEFYISQLHLL
jgi:hypothetical protein